jgi:glutamyl-tRNA synthetase
VQLYRQFGWEPPVFCHLPLLRNPDRSKLSKRKNPTSLEYYRRAGFLPEALRNYLGTMGWSMPDGEEKFTLEEMCARLDLEKISLGGPVFDVTKLKWLNGRYIREDYDGESLLAALERWSLNDETFARIVPLVQPRLDTLSDWGRLTAPFFADEVPLEAESLRLKGKKPGEVVQVLQMAVWRMEAQRDFSTAALDGALRQFADALEIKLRDLTVLLYVALSGSPVWTPLFDSMSILGPDLVRMRLRRAVETLGGVSGKARKKLEKHYTELFGARP